MANQERGELGVDVGGKRYTLRPSFDAMCELEELTGKSLVAWLEVFQTGGLRGLRAVVWCLLHDEHADEVLTLKDASRWIERVGGTDVAMDHVMAVLGINAPPAGETVTDPPPAAQAGTGEPTSSALVGSV